MIDHRRLAILAARADPPERPGKLVFIHRPVVEDPVKREYLKPPVKPHSRAIRVYSDDGRWWVDLRQAARYFDTVPKTLKSIIRVRGRVGRANSTNPSCLISRKKWPGVAYSVKPTEKEN